LAHLSAKAAVEDIRGVAFDHGHRRCGDVPDPVNLPRLLRLSGEWRCEHGSEASHERAAVHLFDYLVRPRQQRGRDGEAEGLGGLDVNDELELRWLLNRNICWLDSAQNLSN